MGRTKTNIDDNTKRAILIYYDNCQNIKKTSYRFNYSIYIIKKILFENGKSTKRGRKTSSINSKASQIMDLWEKGIKNIDFISKKLGVKNQYAVQVLNNHGILTYKPTELEKEIFEMLKTAERENKKMPRGWQVEMAKKNNVSRQWISLIYKKFLSENAER